MSEIDAELRDPVRRDVVSAAVAGEYVRWLEGWAQLVERDDPHIDRKIEALLGEGSA